MTLKARHATWLGVVFVGLTAGVLILKPVSAYFVLAVDDLSQAVAAAAAALSCGWAARRASGSMRVVWIAMAAGCGAWALGETLWSNDELLRGIETPFPSFADAGFLGFPVGATVALWAYPSDGATGASVRRVLDAMTVMLALGVVSWATVLGAMAQAGADAPWAFAIGLAYPVSDLLVVSMTLIALSRTRGHRRALGLIAFGVMAIAVADSAFSYMTTVGTYSTGGLESLGWTGGFTLLAIAPTIREAPFRRDAVVEGARSVSLFPYVPVTVAGIVVGVRLLTDQTLDDLSIVLVALTGIVVLLRQYLTIRDNGRLVRDLAERERQLRQQAFTDGLTGLANRDLFQDRVEHALTLHGRGLWPIAVLFCDLDDFKVVNDTMGHAAGDALLLRVAERLRAAVGPGDSLARLGGDEFGVLLEDTNDPTDVALRMAAALETPFTIDGRTVTATASIGVATIAADERTPTPRQLLSWADTAMYAAKRAGKGGVIAYEQGMALAEVAERDLRSALSDALENGRVRVVYQPIVDVESGEVVAFEALARWRHNGEDVPPQEFVALAEATGLISRLTDVVLERVCESLSAWDIAADSGLRVAVNVSPQQITDREFVGHVATLLDRHGISPERLTLEITETALLHDIDAAAAVTRSLSALGIQMSMDDFGTGYSSLSHLASVTLHSVKIDRMFVSRLGEGDRHDRFARAVLRLGADLGLDVIAEGVEEPHQLAILRDLGCTTAQGFLFGHPEPGGAAAHRLAALTFEHEDTAGRLAITGAPRALA